MSDRKVFEVRLVALGDGDGIPQRRVLLAANQAVIVGRASSNRGVAASAVNTKISNPVISKEHAAFTVNSAGTTILIKDLRSMHGTRVDDRELAQGEERAILSGSTLQFGSSVIRGNATYKPACYVFHAEPVNPTNASANPMPASTAVPPSQAFSDTKKGYGDNSSFYSDDYDSEEDEDYNSDHEVVDVTLVPDTYSSDRDSEVSPDDSVQSSSEDSIDDFDGCDVMSVEGYCSTDSACLATDVAAGTGSTAANKDYSSFYSSYQGDTPSVQPSGPSTDTDVGMPVWGWPEVSEGDQSTFFTSTSAVQTSESAEDFSMDVEDGIPTKRFTSRPFRNSINDLCEPAPKAEATSEETITAVPASEAVNVAPALDFASIVEPTPGPASEVKIMEGIQRLVENAMSSTDTTEQIKIEPIGTKRSAAEAELDQEPTSEPINGVKTDQIATSEQMATRRIASFTRRACDIGIGAVVGGVALFTVLASMNDVA